MIADAAPPPDWRALFAKGLRESPYLARAMLQDRAYEDTLRAWRRHHFTSVRGCAECRIKIPEEVAACPRCRAPASSVKRAAEPVDGVIALACLGIMPARSREPDLDDPDKCRGEDDHRLFEEPHDAHCWLTIASEAWRIRGIEDKTLCLERGWKDDREQLQIDLGRARWGAYCDKAVAFLTAAYP